MKTKIGITASALLALALISSCSSTASETKSKLTAEDLDFVFNDCFVNSFNGVADVTVTNHTKDLVDISVDFGIYYNEKLVDTSEGNFVKIPGEMSIKMSNVYFEQAQNFVSQSQMTPVARNGITCKALTFSDFS